MFQCFSTVVVFFPSLIGSNSAARGCASGGGDIAVATATAAVAEEYHLSLLKSGALPKSLAKSPPYPLSLAVFKSTDIFFSTIPSAHLSLSQFLVNTSAK